MNHSILYYPTIKFQSCDYEWLWNAALFSDKIYRIAPPNYHIKEPRNIEELCSTGEIGIPISPVSYSKCASEEFCDFMHKNQHRAAALSLSDDDESEYIRIHASKMDVKLLNDVFYKLESTDEGDEWFYGNSDTTNLYMTFLANYIAKKNGLALWTNSQELWTASTYFLHNGKIQDSFFPGSGYIEPSEEALLSVMIPDLFPQNLLDISPKLILEFREKRKHERNQFLKAVDDFKDKLNKADSQEVITTIINDEKKKIDYAIREYQKSMDILKVVKFGGILTTLATITTDALGYCNNIPDLYKGIIGSSGVWMNILTGILEKKVGVSEMPYTYLAHINSSFSLYPSSGIIHGKDGFVDKYNYTLYRGFEEFIND